MRAHWPLLVVLTVLLLHSPVGAQIEMARSVVATGGGVQENSIYSLHCTIGQSVTGRTAGSTYINEIGFWYQWIGSVTGISAHEAAAPADFWLGQNRPNPFNPITTIEFWVPHSAHVSMRLYDVAGREVRVLIDRPLDPGIHETVLEATGLPSGIYYCRMQADQYINTRKLVLLK